MSNLGTCSTPREERLTFMEEQTKTQDCYFTGRAALMQIWPCEAIKVSIALPCSTSLCLQVVLEIVVSMWSTLSLPDMAKLRGEQSVLLSLKVNKNKLPTPMLHKSTRLAYMCVCSWPLLVFQHRSLLYEYTMGKSSF